MLLAAGSKGHRYSFPHAKISTAPPIMNRVFGQARTLGQAYTSPCLQYAQTHTHSVAPGVYFELHGARPLPPGQYCCCHCCFHPSLPTPTPPHPCLPLLLPQAVDAQLQANELEYATKYYAAILARATGKDLATCQKEYLAR